MSPKPSKKMGYAGWALTTVLSLFLGFVSIMELSNSEQVQEGFAQLGFTGNIPAIGAALLAGVVLYAYPRTSLFGAALLTAYLGGAVATHVLMNDAASAPAAMVFGLLVWLGLWFREPRLRDLTPWAKK